MTDAKRAVDDGSGNTPPRTSGRSNIGPSASIRLLASLALGLVVGAAVSRPGTWEYGLLLGWMAGAALFLGWIWTTIGSMDAAETAAHALREDTGRALTDLVVLFAAVASLGAVGLLLMGGSGSKTLAAGLSLGSIALAWTIVHTIFTTRYARLYYAGKDGGIGFNEDDPPKYTDFAYLAFTVGMTYQVSDTDLSTKAIRGTVLRQALLSYVFGAVILASTINLIAGLAK